MMQTLLNDISSAAVSCSKLIGKDQILSHDGFNRGWHPFLEELLPGLWQRSSVETSVVEAKKLGRGHGWN